MRLTRLYTLSWFFIHCRHFDHSIIACQTFAFTNSSTFHTRRRTFLAHSIVHVSHLVTLARKVIRCSQFHAESRFGITESHWKFIVISLTSQALTSISSDASCARSKAISTLIVIIYVNILSRSASIFHAFSKGISTKRDLYFGRITR